MEGTLFLVVECPEGQSLSLRYWPWPFESSPC